MDRTDGTRRCCSSPFRRASAIARSHHFAARTWNSAQARMSVVSGKAERCDARRYARTSPRSSRNGCRSRAENREDPVFPSSNGGRLSADAFQQTRLAAYRHRTSDAVRRWHPKKVTPHTLRHGGGHGPAPSRRGSQRDRSLARPRIDRDDSDLPACRHAAQGTSLAHATSSWPRSLTASGRQTPCSPSWRVCDYADRRAPQKSEILRENPHDEQTARGIIRESA